MLAVSVITPSRSSRTASYWSLVIARVLLDCRIDRSPVAKDVPGQCIALSPASVWPITALVDESSVPGPHSGYFAVVGQHGQGAGIQEKVLPAARGQSNPARDENA